MWLSGCYQYIFCVICTLFHPPSISSSVQVICNWLIKNEVHLAKENMELLCQEGESFLIRDCWTWCHSAWWVFVHLCHLSPNIFTYNVSWLVLWENKQQSETLTSLTDIICERFLGHCLLRLSEDTYFSLTFLSVERTSMNNICWKLSPSAVTSVSTEQPGQHSYIQKKNNPCLFRCQGSFLVHSLYLHILLISLCFYTLAVPASTNLTPWRPAFSGLVQFCHETCGSLGSDCLNSTKAYLSF